jgi:hypothetical protein
MAKASALDTYVRIIRIKLMISFMIALVLILIGAYYLLGTKI